MGKVMGGVLGLIGLIVVFYMFPSLITSLDDMKTESYSETFTSVSTGSGVTNASVVLSINLFKDAITSVDSIASSNTNDSPSSESYVTATDRLYIKGLQANTSRNFTIEYRYDDLADYEGLSEFTGLTPLLLFIGALGLVIVGVWRSYTHKGR